MIYSPKMITISELPKFSVDKLHYDQKIQERKFKLIRTLLMMSVLSLLAGRYVMDRKFDKKLVEQHYHLDQVATELQKLKEQAFVDDNYKNPLFRKKYIALDDEYRELKKDHLYKQTNHWPNIVIKSHGECQECSQLQKLGIKGYTR